MALKKIRGSRAFGPLSTDLGTYWVQPVSAEVGLAMQDWQQVQLHMAIAKLAREQAEAEGRDPEDYVVPDGVGEHLKAVTEDEDGRTIDDRITSDLVAQMKANGEPWEIIRLAAETAQTWVTDGWEAAEAHWNNEGRPEGKAPTAPQDHRRKRQGRR